MSENADDMALVAELIQKVFRRLEPLDGVERIASKDEVLTLASKLSGMQITLSKEQLKALQDTARIGGKEGAQGAGENQIYQIRNLLDERQTEQARFLHRVDLAASESRTQTSLISRWKWWALGGVGVTGALLGGLLVALIVIRGEALDFRKDMRQPVLFNSVCQLAGGQIGQTSDGTYCAFFKPE